MSAENNTGTQEATTPGSATAPNQVTDAEDAGYTFDYRNEDLAFTFTARNQIQLRMARPNFFELVVHRVLTNFLPAPPGAGTVTMTASELSDDGHSESETSRNGISDDDLSGSDTSDDHTSNDYTSKDYTSKDQAFHNQASRHGAVINAATSKQDPPFIFEGSLLLPGSQGVPRAILRMDLDRFEGIEGEQRVRRFYESFVEQHGGGQLVDVSYSFAVADIFDDVVRWVVTTELALQEDNQPRDD